MSRGETLREWISSDNLQAPPPQVKTYYLGLKEQYPDEAKDKDPKLVKALVAVFKEKRNLADLQEWLSHNSICNQRNLVTLFRCCLDMPPGHSGPIDMLGICLLECM